MRSYTFHFKSEIEKTLGIPQKLELVGFSKDQVKFPELCKLLVGKSRYEECNSQNLYEEIVKLPKAKSDTLDLNELYYRIQKWQTEMLVA